MAQRGRRRRLARQRGRALRPPGCPACPGAKCGVPHHTFAVLQRSPAPHTSLAEEGLGLQSPQRQCLATRGTARRCHRRHKGAGPWLRPSLLWRATSSTGQRRCRATIQRLHKTCALKDRPLSGRQRPCAGSSEGGRTCHWPLLVLPSAPAQQPRHGILQRVWQRWGSPAHAAAGRRRRLHPGACCRRRSRRPLIGASAGPSRPHLSSA